MKRNLVNEMTEIAPTELFIKDVNKTDAMALISWWSFNSPDYTYWFQPDLSTPQRKRRGDIMRKEIINCPLTRG